MENINLELSKRLLLQDIETIYMIVCHESENKAIFMMGALPYLTAFSDGAIEFMEHLGIDCGSLQLKSIYEPILKKTRSKIKFYKEKTNKNLFTIDTIREAQDEEYANLMRFPALRCLGWHYDLGTYVLNGRYIGNTFLYKWFYSEIEKINQSNPHYEFSFALGECLSFIKLQWQVQYKVEGDFKFSDVENRDFNITRKSHRLLKSGINKQHGLFLFNILCQINFSLLYVKEILAGTNPLHMRMKYIIYYFSCSSINALRRYLCQNPTKTIEINYSEIDKSSSLLNEHFCNCMRHYAIFTDVVDLDSDAHSFSPLIRKYFNMALDEFNMKLDASLSAIAREIEFTIIA